MMSGSSPSIPRIDTDQIPDCVRENIGNTVCLMKSDGCMK